MDGRKTERSKSTSDVNKYDRILVCGDRHWRDYKTIEEKLNKYSHEDTVIITGKAPGADSLAEWWAVITQHDYMGFPARWKSQGKKAGVLRNLRQLQHGLLGIGGNWLQCKRLVLAFHENIEASKGTRDMIDRAKAQKGYMLKVKLIQVSKLTDQVIDERCKKR